MNKPGNGRDTVDLASEFLGIRSPNPFWLASAPPTDKAYNVNRAFEAGWGGVVWKTLGEDPPIVNVSGPRYGAIHSNDRRVIGFNNVELITDRPLETNLKEIRQVKRDWPDRALVVSVMLPMKREAWAKYVPMIEDTGADALELNFGCPHGMSERGMGSAVGQVPEYIQQAAEWCKSVAQDTGHRQADAERHEHPAAGEGGEGGRRGRGLAHQHAELDHARRLRHADDVSGDGWQGLSRRLLRAGSQADRAPHGRRDRAQSGDEGAADLRHRRRHRLAGRGRFPRARREQRAGLHGRDGLWLQDHRRPHERAFALPARQGHEAGRRAGRPRRALGDRLAVPQPELRREGAHRPGPLHQVRPLPHRLRGRVAPGDHAHREWRAALRSHRRGMRRLQSLRQRLPGRRLHHDGASDRRASTRGRAAPSTTGSRTGRRTRTTRCAGPPDERGPCGDARGRDRGGTEPASPRAAFPLGRRCSMPPAA